MIQESRAQYPPQMVDAERLRGLQRLRSSIDPFQEGPDGERLRAIGLSNLYLKMADPSVEFLESVIARLTSITFSNLRQLQLDTYKADENPRGFFAKHGIAIENPERLQTGIGHSGELIDNLVHRYDYQTGELRWGEKLDPKALAESVYERIQISNGEMQIRKAAERVHNEPNLRRKYRLGLRLKRQILDYINSFSFTFYRRHDRDNPLEPTWENLTQYSDLSIEIDSKEGRTSGSYRVMGAVNVAQAAILRYPFEKRLQGLPTRDKDRFDQLRLQYGAKAANLTILSELVEDINRLRKARFFDGKLVVPDFQAVPVDLYRDWREEKPIDDALLYYFNWASALKDNDSKYSDEPIPADYIVRSSAVFSEDGETVTGAGIYESVRVRGGATFQEFRDAVARVYKSTDSARAQSYRAQHGVDKEEMGLLIQEYITPDTTFLPDQSWEGYVNSKLAGVPQLMEIVTRTSRNFVNREELDFCLGLRASGNEDAFQSIHHFPPDQYKIRPMLPIKAAQFTSAVEKIWGKDIQVEFVFDDPDIYFVQVRELPASVGTQAPEIQFSDELPIYTGASIGICDMKLPVLDAGDDNSEKTGVVVFPENYNWANSNNVHQLPKEGAVIIYNDGGQNGHIQTLCAEKGLICLFPDRTEDDRSAPSYNELSRVKRIRVVSNGIEARVYKR